MLKCHIKEFHSESLYSSLVNVLGKKTSLDLSSPDFKPQDAHLLLVHQRGAHC